MEDLSPNDGNGLDYAILGSATGEVCHRVPFLINESCCAIIIEEPTTKKGLAARTASPSPGIADYLNLTLPTRCMVSVVSPGSKLGSATSASIALAERIIIWAGAGA